MRVVTLLIDPSLSPEDQVMKALCDLRKSFNAHGDWEQDRMIGETVQDISDQLYMENMQNKSSLEPEDPDDFEDQDDGPYLSHSQQCFQDRADYANEQLRAGNICPEQADEIRHGA